MAALVVGALVFVGCSTVDQATLVDRDASGDTTVTGDARGSAASGDALTVSADVLEGLQQAVDEGVNRWEGPTVSVSVSGTVTERDRQIVDETLAAFEPLSGLTFERVDAGGDIDLAFIPTDGWPPDDLNADTGDETVETEPGGEPVDDLGLTTWETDDDGFITEAQVYVDPAISQALRNSTISHELTHALGLGHVECVTSIVDDGTELDLDWVPTSFDDALIRAWYDSDLPPFTVRPELADLVTIDPGAPGCEPWTIEGVESDGTEVLACAVSDAEYRPCVVYDGSGPLPSPTTWTPTQWVDEDWVYTYDPERYEEIDADGQRAICELEPADDPRRPCEITDGPGPITNPTLWTDGEYTYDTP